MVQRYRNEKNPDITKSGPENRLFNGDAAVHKRIAKGPEGGTGAKQKKRPVKNGFYAPADNKKTKTD